MTTLPIRGALAQLVIRGLDADAERVVVSDGDEAVTGRQVLREARRLNGKIVIDPSSRRVDQAVMILAGLASGNQVVVEMVSEIQQDTALDGTMLAVRTSGTTAMPKTVAYGEAALLAGYVLLQDFQSSMYASHGATFAGDWSSPDQLASYASEATSLSLCLASLSPPTTIAGVTTLIRSAIDRGSICFLDPRGDPEMILDRISSFGAATLSCPPLWAELLARFGRSIPKLFHIGVGGDGVSPGTLTRLEAAMGCTCTVGYGFTEAGGVVAMSRLDDPATVRHSTTGRVVPGVEVRIDRGRIMVRSPASATLMVDSVGTTFPRPGHWIDSGDLGSLDDDGALRVFGRADDVIVRGGRRIHPAAIENRLEAHPQVREAVVFGVPNRRVPSHDIAAVVTLSGEVDPTDLRRWCAAGLDPGDVPKWVRPVEHLHDLRASNGKISRFALGRQFVK